jgi:hypothetical protein
MLKTDKTVAVPFSTPRKKNANPLVTEKINFKYTKTLFFYY